MKLPSRGLIPEGGFDASGSKTFNEALADVSIKVDDMSVEAIISEIEKSLS
jgi:hypothetical protein